MAAMWGAFLGGRPAHAHRRDFPFTYDWQQASKGENEIESHTTYSRTDHSLVQETEYEHGFSNRFMVAPYIVYGRDAGQGLRYQGFRVESRYRLGDFSTGRWLPGLYLEFEKPRAETGEIEGKLILSRYDRHGGDFSVNLIVEQTLKSGTQTRKTASFGYALPVGRSKYDIRGGVECIRSIDDAHITFGPVLGFSATKNISVVGGYGFPLNRHDINKGEMRLLAEYEWF